MNEQNFEYLKDQLKFTGFGVDLNGQLKENLQKPQNEFTLSHLATYGKDEVASRLHFKKSTESDRFFFNSYDASLKKENSENTLRQNFPIHKDGSVTRKEAYNLLDGRAVNKDLVNKDGKLYNAWIELNFKETTSSGNFKLQRYSEQYGFDLEKALSRLPIKEIGNVQDKSKLLDSLRKGNRQAITLSGNDSDQKAFVEASPKFKSIVVYDQNHQRIRQNQSEKNAVSQSQQQAPDKAEKLHTKTEDHMQQQPRKSKGQKM
ncbi:hypothetical protein SAMN04487995_5987 [Dyadobacter koreensis]|uniref:DUF3945 domain-containing protein n=1 Tax=Dyadobacter koreensis TaxID=408657 RepID=A0A1H7B4X4_9BACT|nr:hypothetical protein [Dyadobacter koreensis]SEJ69492.1 hypothetical protein SAMN04487995_5987 [Dyadobacter koreensis]